MRRVLLSETDFSDTVIALARWNRWRVVHFRPAQTTKGWRTPFTGDKGFVDLVLARAGVVLLAELKSDTGRLGPGQPEWAEAIGAQYRLWRPIDMEKIRKELR